MTKTTRAIHTHPDQRMEERDVTVADPVLSPEANQRLTDDVRDVIGKHRVRVPAKRPHPSRGERPSSSVAVSVLMSHRLFVGQGAAAVVVLAAVVALTVGSWWILGGALLVLLVALAAVIALILGMTRIREQPSPATVAALEEEGVRDPEAFFSRIVEEFTEDEGARRANRRTVSVEDDPAKAAAEEQTAMTPTGGPSTPVGPASESSGSLDPTEGATR